MSQEVKDLDCNFETSVKCQTKQHINQRRR